MPWAQRCNIHDAHSITDKMLHDMSTHDITRLLGHPEDLKAVLEVIDAHKADDESKKQHNDPPLVTGDHQGKRKKKEKAPTPTKTDDDNNKNDDGIHNNDNRRHDHKLQGRPSSSKS